MRLFIAIVLLTEFHFSPLWYLGAVIAQVVSIIARDHFARVASGH
jgi:hypothetical protein